MSNARPVPTRAVLLPLAAIVLVMAMGRSAVAAVPTVDHLYPAGCARGQSVEVTAAGKLEGATSAWCDHDGVRIEVKEKNKLTVTVSPDALPGPCWIRLHNAEGASIPRRFFVSTLPEILESEPNDRHSDSTPAAASGTVVNGVLSKRGDVDTFAVELKQGQTVVASMCANERLASPMDAVLQIVSPTGFVLDQNDDEHGFDPQLVFDVPADGTYYVRTFAFPAQPNSTIGFSGAGNFVYRLTITTGPYLDHTTPIAVSGDSAVDVAPVGWNIPPDRSPLPITAAPPSRFHKFVADGFPNTFLMPVEPHAVIAESAGDNAESPQELSLPVSVSGNISSAGEVDVYRFQAKKGDKLEFQVEARSFGQRLDPVLRLMGSDGNTLQEVDDIKTDADPVLARVIPADGEYRIAVWDRFGHGGFRYAYLLRCLPQGAEFSLALKADQFVLPADKPLEIPVTVDRLTGFPHEIKISVEGLPTGVTAEPVVSAAKGDSAKSVKLVLTGGESAEAFSGPVRIVGRSVAELEVVRHASAVPAGLTESISDVWLTVTAKK